MKLKFSRITLILATALGACSQDSMLPSDTTDGQEIITTVGVKAPEQLGTRAVPNVYTNPLTWAGESGYPSVGNVDLNEHPLSYTVGIYIGKETTVGEGDDAVTSTVWTLVDRQVQTEVPSDEAYFNFRLIKGRTYRIVAYADFASSGKDDLREIAFSTDLNDELDDAFFVSEEFVAQEHIAAVLKRPFGKLRLIARDFNTFAKGEKFTVTDVKVEYTGQPMLATDKFDALTGEFNYDATAAGDHTVNNVPASYALEYNANNEASWAAVFTHYLPANFGEEDKTGTYTPVDETLAVPQSWMYPFNVTVTYQDETGTEYTLTREFQLDIPVKRNWLTTVDAANFWTDNSSIKVSVDHRFDGFITEELPIIETVNSEQELTAAIAAINSASPYTGTIVLGSDFEITESELIRIYGGGNHAIDITLDLNGHSIEQKTTDAAALFEIRGQGYPATLTIEDSSKEGTGALLTTDRGTCAAKAQTIWCMFGGKVIINAGTIKCCGDNSAVYSYDDEKYINENDWTPSVIEINGGWFENIDGNTTTGVDYGGQYYYEWLINIRNDVNIGKVYLNGGSYVGFNPANGDNVAGDTVNKWVDDDHYVVTETIDDNTVYTVLAKENPSDY